MKGRWVSPRPWKRRRILVGGWEEGGAVMVRVREGKSDEIGRREDILGGASRAKQSAFVRLITVVVVVVVVTVDDAHVMTFKCWASMLACQVAKTEEPNAWSQST